ncbi:hypothetical protein DASC09_027980 [Saccharomycopsis crataegensis]|uniref:Protein-serine/threonine kinase n=1 Tax=Saccharomycopsis crataegensis TaxID=43959 RepID=A0AAV5QMT5_9ASCO|nr:hypothetical protein DASC09_027980 [Saccharomycopsis crataegensis]
MSINKSLLDKIYTYAKYPPTGVSIRQMVNFGVHPNVGTLFRASQFVVEELPIRLAHRIKELDHLPNGLSLNPSIVEVKHWYAKSFDELTSLPRPQIAGDLKKLLYPTSINDHHRKYYVDLPDTIYCSSDIYEYNDLVTNTLTKIKKRHDPTVATIAKGVLEWKHLTKGPDVIDSSIQQFLDRFYMSRIGIRMLIGQHIALNKEPLRDDYVGIICKHTNVGDLAQDAIENARYICEQYFGLYEAPKVELYCADNIEFMYVPSHLMHMLFEILKNSLRATVEYHLMKQQQQQQQLKGDAFDIYNLEFPPIKVIVANGNEDITIKISDEGGGIPRSAMPLIWTYLYTTAKDIPDIDNIGENEFIAPMAGLGYGISLSRLYARYFGGDLKLISMEGYGTDAYIHLNKLGGSTEPLP